MKSTPPYWSTVLTPKQLQERRDLLNSAVAFLEQVRDSEEAARDCVELRRVVDEASSLLRVKRMDGKPVKA